MMEEVPHPEEHAPPHPAVPASNVTIPPIANSIQQESNEKIEVGEGSDDKEQQGGGWGWTGWLKSASSNQFVQKVMEKTKTGVDKMITTLDPGMTPFIKEGGDVCLVVASDKEVKWGAVRDAFQSVFGAATVKGVAAQPTVAPQPVGYTAGMKGAQERIKYLRKSGLVDEKQACVAVENFIVEQLPDHWFDVGCVLLDDPANSVTFELFTLAVPVDNDVITDMQKATPSDYDLRWSGLAVTVGETIQKRLLWVKPSDWHKAITGCSRRDIIYSAALSLAELYKRRLPVKNLEQDI